MPKKSIRGRLLAQRKQLPAETVLHHSLRIQEQLLRTPEFAAAATVALYSPILNEVFVEEVFHGARSNGKRVAYPRVCGGTLEFVEVKTLADLRPGSFGILEPAGERIVPAAGLDLVAVPGLAFDVTGHRLGYGKGLYDRVLHLAEDRRVLVGLAFAFQILEALPAEAHDVRMDLLICEERILRPDRSAAARDNLKV